MDQGAMNYVVRVLVQRILALILFWLGARSELSWHVWIYFGTIFAISIAASVIMLRVNPETLSQRARWSPIRPLGQSTIRIVLDFALLRHPLGCWTRMAR